MLIALYKPREPAHGPAKSNRTSERTLPQNSKCSVPVRRPSRAPVDTGFRRYDRGLGLLADSHEV